MDIVQIYEITNDDTNEVMGYTFTTDHIGRGVLCDLEGNGLGGSVTGTSNKDLKCNGIAVVAEWWGEREL